jgi:hypothetical protein
VSRFGQLLLQLLQTPVPELIDFIQDRDLWKWQKQDSGPYLAALDSLPFTFAAWVPLLSMSAAQANEFLQKGRHVQERITALCESIADNALPCTVLGRPGLWVSATPELATEVGSILYGRCGTYGMVLHVVNPSTVKVSLRSSPSFDAPPLAAAFGGGGHLKACSFTLPPGAGERTPGRNPDALGRSLAQPGFDFRTHSSGLPGRVRFLVAAALATRRRTLFWNTMNLHSYFTATKPSKRGLAARLNQPEHQDGAYARVVVLDDYTVLKATSCPATNLLFEDLRALAKAGDPYPDALPAVFRDHGTCLTDSCGIPFRAWEVERLFRGGDADAMRRARINGRKSLAKLKPAYAKRVSRLEAPSMDALNQALRQEQSILGTRTGRQACTDLTGAMSVRTTGTLREGFLFLEEFVRRHELELDLLTQGNLLLDMFGQPVFSDPVSELFPVGESLARAASPVELHCLVAETPVELLSGFQVKTAYRSTFGLGEEALELAQAACRAAGLRPTRLRWDDPLRTQMLRKPAQVRTLWSMPEAPQRLREGIYDQVFLTC